MNLRKIAILSLFGVVIQLLSAGFAMALTTGIPSSDLFFKLSNDTAFIKDSRNADSSSAEEADIAFSLKWTGTPDTISIVDMKFTFDSDSLEFVDGSYDSTIWDTTNSSITSPAAGEVVLHFQGGALETSSSYMALANIRLRPLCQSKLNTTALNFTSVPVENEITLDNPTEPWSPDSSQRIGGSVTTAEHVGTYTIESKTMTDGPGNEFWAPITASANYSTYVLDIGVGYDTSRLEIVGDTVIDWATRWYQEPLIDTTTPGIAVYRFLDYMSFYRFEPSNDTLAMIKFRTKCATNAFNDTTVLSFDSTYLLLDCFENIPNTTFTNGTIIRNASVSLEAVLASGSPTTVSRSIDTTITWNIQMANSFTVGNARTPFTEGEGINIGMNMNSDGFIFGSVNPSSADLLFNCVPGANRGEGVIRQLYDGAKTNYRAVSNNVTDMVNVDIQWDPIVSSFVVPTWANRFMTPVFMDTVVRDGGGEFVTGVPDTTLCAAASISNGALTFGGFQDAVELIMADFYGIGHTNSFGPCAHGDIYVKSNFTIGDLTLTVSTNTSTCISTISSLYPGLTATKVDSVTWTITCNSLFDSISVNNDSTLIGRVNSGIKGTCLGNKNLSVGFSLVSNDVRDINTSIVQFGRASGAYYKARCNSGSGCNQCSAGGVVHDLPLQFRATDDGSALPKEFALNQNFPNPFNPSTKIELAMPVASEWEITIYNIAGQKVEEFSGFSAAGVVSVEWNASGYSSGMYLYKATAGTFTTTKKMVLLK